MFVVVVKLNSPVEFYAGGFDHARRCIIEARLGRLSFDVPEEPEDPLRNQGEYRWHEFYQSQADPAIAISDTYEI